MKAYLDNSATTKALEQVKDKMVTVLMEDYGNPSSMHMHGVRAEQHVKNARAAIAKTLKADEKEIVFTSGGTEANNLAIIGAAMANRRAGMHLITTEIEHPSVHATMGFLEEQGFRVTYLKVNEFGEISLEELEAAICEDTILISVMYVNNEIGSVMPIDEIGALIQRKKPDILFHVDAIQAYGKFEIYPKRKRIDLLSVSGHKIHGPKGIGFLYIKEKTKIKPTIFGGGQQKGVRSGTENVPGIVGIGVAAEAMYENLQEHREHLFTLKNCLISGLQELPEVVVHGRLGEDSAPHIVNASFVGVRSEVLLHALEEREIYVSAGSACASNKQAVSATLKGIGLLEAERESALRFSLSHLNTIEEIEYTLEVLGELLAKLRLYRRR
jgi:cysteine desulfurase